MIDNHSCTPVFFLFLSYSEFICGNSRHECHWNKLLVIYVKLVVFTLLLLVLLDLFVGTQMTGNLVAPSRKNIFGH